MYYTCTSWKIDISEEIILLAFIYVPVYIAIYLEQI